MNLFGLNLNYQFRFQHIILRTMAACLSVCLSCLLATINAWRINPNNSNNSLHLTCEILLLISDGVPIATALIYAEIFIVCFTHNWSECHTKIRWYGWNCDKKNVFKYSNAQSHIITHFHGINYVWVSPGATKILCFRFTSNVDTVYRISYPTMNKGKAVNLR